MLYKHLLKEERAGRNDRGREREKDGGWDRKGDAVSVWAEKTEENGLIRAKRECREKHENTYEVVSTYNTHKRINLYIQ